jgi:uncharacterized DUF497 family protein
MPWQPVCALGLLTIEYTTYIRLPDGHSIHLPRERFIWDSKKASTNITKHGVSFEIACQVFFDPLIRIADAAVDEEERDAAIGQTEDWTLLVVVHLEQERDAIRIISARPATAQERRTYEDNE